MTMEDAIAKLEKLLPAHTYIAVEKQMLRYQTEEPATEYWVYYSVHTDDHYLTDRYADLDDAMTEAVKEINKRIAG